MVPETQQERLLDFTYKEISTRTFRLDFNLSRVVGYTDQLAAMEQAVYLILNVERYDYLIHSWNYGVELKNLIGKPIPFVLSEVERLVTEALLQDDRITDVTDFQFETKKHKVHATFTVKTIFGDLETEKEVEI